VNFRLCFSAFFGLNFYFGYYFNFMNEKLEKVDSFKKLQRFSDLLLALLFTMPMNLSSLSILLTFLEQRKSNRILKGDSFEVIAKKGLETIKNIEKDVLIRKYPEYNLTTLGIRHTADYLVSNYSLIKSLVDEANVVLLEGGLYFEVIGKYAKKMGKEVVDIDRRSEVILYCKYFANYLNFYFSYDLLRDAWFSGIDEKWVNTYLKDMTIAQLFNLVPPSFFFSTLLNGLSDKYPFARDISFVGDGRTVLMLREIYNILERCNGKKVLVIAGRAHVVGFDYYMQKEDFFNLKKLLYRIIYYIHINFPDEIIVGKSDEI